MIGLLVILRFAVIKKNIHVHVPYLIIYRVN